MSLQDRVNWLGSDEADATAAVTPPPALDVDISTGPSNQYLGEEVGEGGG